MKETKVYNTEEFSNIDGFCNHCCACCTAMPDGYCPCECDFLEKARKIPFEKINAKWVEHEGDIRKVVRYIKQYKFMSRRKK